MRTKRDPDELTRAERETLWLAGSYRSQAEVAAERGTSVRTVHFHLANAYRKLGVNRLEDALVEIQRRCEGK